MSSSSVKWKSGRGSMLGGSPTSADAGGSARTGLNKANNGSHQSKLPTVNNVLNAVVFFDRVVSFLMRPGAACAEEWPKPSFSRMVPKRLITHALCHDMAYTSLGNRSTVKTLPILSRKLMAHSQVEGWIGGKIHLPFRISSAHGRYKRTR